MTVARLCEYCGKRRVDLFYAMITVELDFSQLCCCDASPEFAEAAAAGPVIVCKKCCKRMPDMGSGDSLQWIFRHSFCSCALPDPYQLDPNMVEELVQQLMRTKRRDRPRDEPEIQVEKRKFPIENFKPLKQLESVRGRVFKCRDRDLGTLVAVKILRNLQPHQLAQLQQEVEPVSELDHENILKILDLGLYRDAYPFIVSEYADGETLHNLIQQSGRIEIYTAVNIITQVCKGLNHAHGKGLYHWNLTPDNILLKNTPKSHPIVKILDFGLALNAINECTFETKEGLTLVGTPGYMSPEQAQGQPIDARSEVYSIGCILFEMLTGKPPFRGETAMDVLVQQTERPLPKLREFARRDFPKELEKILSKCLQKDKEDRYTSAFHLKNALSTFASHTTVTAEETPQPGWKTALQENKILVCIVLLGLLLGSTWAAYSWLSSESAYNALGKSGLPMENFLATMGSDYAKVQLGRKYLDGNGVQQDRRKAEMLFNEAASHGSAPAKFWLGYCYLKGFTSLHPTESYYGAVSSISEATENDRENNARAYDLISQAAEEGYPDAERYMGLLIRLGMEPSGKIAPPNNKGLMKRLKNSASWLETAAEHGDAEAKNYVGIEKAAEFGWSPYLHEGNFDYSDKSNQLKEDAFKLFREAGQAGQPDAQYNLALCYELGVGTPVDNVLAKKWYQLAAESGLSDAQYRYGFLLELETSADALKWYKMAAEQDNLYAEIALCRLYSQGFCVAMDGEQAQYWFDKVRERPDRFYTARPSAYSVNLQQSQEKAISSMERICKEHLEMPHLLIQRWGPSGIKCWPRGPMRDIDLVQLSTMQDVTYLDLYGMRIHDPGTKFLRGLPLTMLRLVGQDLSRAGYSNLAKLKSLKGLEVSGDTITDGLGQLRDCNDLVFVGVTGLITQETVDELSAIKSLKNIAFHCRKDVSLASWSRLPNLEVLRLDEATQKTINSLAAMKNLKALTIAAFKPTGSSEKLDLAPLINLPRLEKLRLNQVFDKHIVAQLKSLTRLKNLSISSTKGVADADLLLLKQIPAKEIEIFLDADCQITDKGLMILGAIPNVTHVNISVSPVTPGGVKAFRAKFPNHTVSYLEAGKAVKGKTKDQVEEQVEKQIKAQLDKQIEEQEQEKDKQKDGPDTGTVKATGKGSDKSSDKKANKKPRKKSGKNR